jgi:hypothetical protein
VAFSRLCAAQGNNTSDVHLFQTFSRDAAIAENTYGEGILGYSDYDFFSNLNFGVRAGFPVNNQFEISGGLGFVNVDPEFGNGESGITDLRVNGKYFFPTRSKTQISAGASLTLPIGSEDIGQGEANLGFFGALRHAASSKTTITAILGLDLIEAVFFGDGGIPGISAGSLDQEASLYLGGGVIQQLNNQLHLVGELNFATEGDYAMLSGGLDYRLQSGGRLRGMLGIGLDDGAADITLLFGYLLFF